MAVSVDIGTSFTAGTSNVLKEMYGATGYARKPLDYQSYYFHIDEEKIMSDTTDELRKELKAAEKAERKKKALERAEKKAEAEIREASHIALHALVKQAKAGDADAARYILQSFGYRA